MLYLLGGAPRAGKSLVSRKFVQERAVPYFCLDTLTGMVQDGLPSFGIKHGHPYIPKAEKLWPLVKPMLDHLESHEENYLVEGDMLLPSLVRPILDGDQGRVRGCFIGFTEISASDKLREIRQHSDFKDDWTSEYDDQVLLKKVGGMIDFSKFIKKESEQLGLKYFDVSKGFDSVVDEVYNYLTSD